MEIFQNLRNTIYIENLHNHKQVPPKTGKFRIDNQIIFLHSSKKHSQLSLDVSLCATDCLLNSAVNGNIILLTEIVNLEPLIPNSLLVAANSKVTVNHNPKVKSAIITYNFVFLSKSYNCDDKFL